MKRKFGYLFLMLLLLFVAVPVGAKSEKGFYADNNLTVSEEQDSTMFAAGNYVNVNSKINGLAFIAGNSVTIKSEQDYLFAAGSMVTLSEVTAKDAFVAGSQITIESSKIRDLFAAAEVIVINSDVDRNAFLGGESIEINSTINGDLKVACSELVLGENAKILGTLYVPEAAKTKIDEGASVEKIEKYKDNVDIDGKEIAEKTAFAVFVAAIVSFIVGLISKIVIGLIFMFLFKKVFDKIDEEDKSAGNFFTKFGIGFGVLCLTPIVAIILMITGILFPISIIGLIVYGIFIYLSAIVTAYYVGGWVFKDSIKNDYLRYMASIAILLVIFKIPFIGGLCKFFSLCVGLGILSTLLVKTMTFGKETKKAVKEVKEEVVEQPEVKVVKTAAKKPAKKTTKKSTSKTKK